MSKPKKNGGLKIFKFLAIILLILSLATPAFSKNITQLFSRVIITSIGVDKNDDKIKMSCEIYVPQKDNKATAEKRVVTVEQVNISKCVDALGTATGKLPSFNHCKILFLGEKIFDGEHMNVIDYFMFSGQLQGVCNIYATKDAAKLIKTISKSQNDTSMNVENFLIYNDLNFHGGNVPALLYLSSLQDMSETVALPFLNLEKDLSSSSQSESADKQGSGGQDSGMGQTSSNESEKGKSGISDESESANSGKGSDEESERLGQNIDLCMVNRKGILGILKEEDVEGYMLFDRDSVNGIIDIGEFKWKELDSRFTSIHVKKKKVKLKVELKEGKIVYKLKITILGEIDQLDNFLTVDSLNSQKYQDLEEALARQMSNVVAARVSNSFEAAKKANADIYQVRQNAYRFFKHDYDYLEDILQNASIEIKVDCEITA